MKQILLLPLFFLLIRSEGLTEYQRQEVEKYTKMIKENPNDPSPYYLKASHLWPYEGEAVPDYKKALRLYLKNKNSISEVTRDDFLKAMGASKNDFISKGLYFKKIDLDEDGIVEVLLTNLDGLHSTFNFIFYQGKDGKWYINYFRNPGDYLKTIHLRDLNKNGIIDMVYENLNGAVGSHSFCMYEFVNGEIETLCESDINRGGGELEFKDLDGDGIEEIIYTCSPSEQSVFYEFGIGPHLEFRKYYKWNGYRYMLYKKEYTNNSFNLLHQFLLALMRKDFKGAYELVNGKKFLERAGFKDSFDNFKDYISKNFPELLKEEKPIPFDGGKVHDLGYGSPEEFKYYEKLKNKKTYLGSLKFRKSGKPFRLLLLWKDKKWSIIGIESYTPSHKLPPDGDIYNREF